jgi:hypothetical protein
MLRWVWQPPTAAGDERNGGENKSSWIEWLLFSPPFLSSLRRPKPGYQTQRSLTAVFTALHGPTRKSFSSVSPRLRVNAFTAQEKR